LGQLESPSRFPEPDFWGVSEMKKGTCLLCLFVAGYFTIYGNEQTRPETLQRLVAQNVKIGYSPEDVTRFLDEQRLEHCVLFGKRA
jgi:hypothetical protein